MYTFLSFRRYACVSRCEIRLAVMARVDVTHQVVLMFGAVRAKRAPEPWLLPALDFQMPV